MSPWLRFCCYRIFLFFIRILTFWNRKYKYYCLYLFLCSACKEVVSDSPGLVDFAIGLVNPVFNLPDGQLMFFE